MVAIQVGCKRLNDFSFSNKTPSSTGNYELFTSCEPCAMCLGAILWSGVKRVVCGASKVDAENIGFDEGPVFDESYTYMSNHGVTIEREVLREDAAAVLNLYASDESNAIYNGKS
jgi:tRNA(Arg) A34 adenosine deaminase TadA